MVQNGWGMAMDGEEKAGLWRSPWEASGRGGRQGHQKGTMGPLWPGSLLRAGQLDHLDRLGTWVGGTKAQMEAGRAECLAGRRTGFHPPLNRDLGSGPQEGRGKPGACSQLWRGAVPDPADNGQHQTGEVDTNSLCITAAKAKPGPAGQEGWGQGPGKRHPV